MILDRILNSKRRELVDAKERTPLKQLIDRTDKLSDRPSPSRSFVKALSDQTSIALIAEVKKASPSKGVIRENFDPEELAMAYAQHGASAISVLTDEPFFQGSTDHLKSVRQTVDIPVLRKEFIIDPYQVYETKLLHADALLLIVAALSDDELRRLLQLARSLDLDALVEVHTKDELERALACGARIIGVNNRDLRTFHTTVEVSLELAEMMPERIVKVSESGISGRDDLVLLEQHGFDAVLIGEAITKADDVGEKIRELLGQEATQA